MPHLLHRATRPTSRLRSCCCSSDCCSKFMAIMTSGAGLLHDKLPCATDMEGTFAAHHCMHSQGTLLWTSPAISCILRLCERLLAQEIQLLSVLALEHKTPYFLSFHFWSCDVPFRSAVRRSVGIAISYKDKGSHSKGCRSAWSSCVKCDVNG